MNPVTLLYHYSDMKKGDKKIQGKVRWGKGRQRMGDFFPT